MQLPQAKHSRKQPNNTWVLPERTQVISVLGGNGDGCQMQKELTL